MDPTVIARLATWIDARVGAAGAARTGMRKVFPEHWSFLLGEIALYTLVVLLLTGTYLALFFDPSLEKLTYEGAYVPLHGVEVSAAYASTLDLSFGVRAGLFVRQVHHWAALVFVAAIVVHLLRIFFTGAFRRPREINWMIGVTLLILALIEGFAGYSLPDDLLSGTGLRIGYSMVQSVPIVGTWLAFLLFGGEFPGEVVVHRLFIGHVWILPVVLVGLVSVHLALVARQKHTHFPGSGRTNRNVVGQRLWPTYATKSTGLFFLLSALLALLGGFAQINPVWLYGPFDPTTVTAGAQPDWYMGWVEGALRLLPAFRLQAFGYELPNAFFAGVLLPGVTFLAMYLYPFVEQRLTRAGDREHHVLDRPREHPWRTSFGVAALTFYTVLFVAGSNDIVAEITGLPVIGLTNVLRLLALVLPVVAGTVAFRVCDQLRRVDHYRERKAHLEQMAGTDRS